MFWKSYAKIGKKGHRIAKAVFHEDSPCVASYTDENLFLLAETSVTV